MVEKRREGKESFISMAHGLKGQVNTMKEHARQVQGQMLAEKKAHAAKERDNDYLVQQEKIRALARRKQQHQNVYSKKVRRCPASRGRPVFCARAPRPRRAHPAAARCPVLAVCSNGVGADLDGSVDAASRRAGEVNA